MKVAWISLALVAGVAGCTPRTEVPAPVVAKPVDGHTSQNSIDWAGLYEGVLPCADCPGIKTRLTLNRDGSYERSSAYLDRQAEPQVVRGRFEWNPAGSAISLDTKGGAQRFAVGEGRLMLLDPDGTPPGPQSPDRILTLVRER